MARYMGGPRCRPALAAKFRRRPAFVPRRISEDSNEDQDQDGCEQTRDEIPDSDDHDGSSQADDGGLLRQGQPNTVEGENGNGVAYNDDNGYDSDSEPTASGSGFVYPFPGLNGRVHTEIPPSNNVPRPKRQRSLSIPIHYKSPFSTGMLTFEPPPLPIAYGWMVRGTAEHVEDLHLSGIPFCSKEVHSKTKIEVLGEYTWIEVTPSQEESYERFPAIYVPGNARTWRPIQTDTSLHQEDVRSITTQKIRDDNAHHQPRYPYEPALRALESAGKVTSLNEVDIVTDTDTLTQLLSFIMGTSAARRVKEPFRLELKTVRNTLFIHPSHKPGSSQAGPPSKKTRHDPSVSVPDWAAGVLGHIGTRAARLPYSGGHYRLVRYRFGSVVLVVRVKVDFAYEHRKDAPRAHADPLSEVQPEFMPRQEGDVAQIWKTTVQKSGVGTRPAAAGVASVRYMWQDQKVRMRALLPQLWFSRTPFVVDCQVSYPDLCVKEVSLVNSRQWYPSYERGYQNSLRRLAGLLKHLQDRTREMGGNIVLIADPVQVCFVLLKPVIDMSALPEDLILKFWGPDTEKEERERRLAEMDRESTPDQEQSDLTDLSSTPSLPSESDIANVGLSQNEQSHNGNGQLGQSQPKKSHGAGDAAPERIPGGSPTRAERQLAQGIDPVKMITEWNKSVGSPVRQSVEDGGAEYEAGDESSAPYDIEASFDGNRSSSSEGSVMVGESAQEAGVEGSDGVLNSLALQMNRPGVMQESHDNLTAVARAADVEVLRGQHSLLMVDRHLTSGMHSSSDDEWPPRPPAHPNGRITNAAPDVPEPRHSHGDLELRSIRSGTCIPTAPTPPGPSDFDSAGEVIPRNRRDSDDREAYSDDDVSTAARGPRRPPSAGRYNLTASGRARLMEPGMARRTYIVVDTDSEDDSDDDSDDDLDADVVDGLVDGSVEDDLHMARLQDEYVWSEGEDEDDEDHEDEDIQENGPTSIIVADSEEGDHLQNGAAENHDTTDDDLPAGAHHLQNGVLSGNNATTNGHLTPSPQRLQNGVSESIAATNGHLTASPRHSPHTPSGED